MPQPTLDFYTRVLGMTLLDSYTFAEMGFTLYFLGYDWSIWLIPPLFYE